MSNLQAFFRACFQRPEKRIANYKARNKTNKQNAIGENKFRLKLKRIGVAWKHLRRFGWNHQLTNKMKDPEGNG